MNVSTVTVKRMPEPSDRRSHGPFYMRSGNLSMARIDPGSSLDLSGVEQLLSESIDLLLECVDHAEGGDGEVSVPGASNQTVVILELTRVASVLNLFPSVAEAVTGWRVHDFESARPPHAT
jgi:ABC-type transporter Mla MlaB component